MLRCRGWKIWWNMALNYKAFSQQGHCSQLMHVSLACCYYLFWRVSYYPQWLRIPSSGIHKKTGTFRVEQRKYFSSLLVTFYSKTLFLRLKLFSSQSIGVRVTEAKLFDTYSIPLVLIRTGQHHRFRHQVKGTHESICWKSHGMLLDATSGVLSCGPFLYSWKMSIGPFMTP